MVLAHVMVLACVMVLASVMVLACVMVLSGKFLLSWRKYWYCSVIGFFVVEKILALKIHSFFVENTGAEMLLLLAEKMLALKCCYFSDAIVFLFSKYWH